MYFSKKIGRLSQTRGEILTFGSHCSAQSILDCFIPNFKLKYEDAENIKTNHVSTAYVESKTGNIFGTSGRKSNCEFQLFYTWRSFD